MDHDTRHHQHQFRGPPVAIETMRTFTAVHTCVTGLQVIKVAHRGHAVRMVL